ncbi:hypothetical protein SELMODRAFT_268800 [Selaginella moellendorffii]|uniref:Fatty acid desaturase domain-containing protein n=1 Tax=Selaginella moellendorffii TaxID=88036 RepID=D8SKJ7_SELML|nr:delta(12)-acyl-lipid-desaturase [Selaginella moellendorffii]EFJ14993.1 hypothetical protein SELMODRAFT_268800 [Selaginella moellendorffii]|eukprot:XP_002983981.1 delta(12)-acyl-lipid-desaturase [Selaginella moellendorffii]
MECDAKLLDRVPTGKPPFSLGDIKKAVPKHCFQRSLLRSSAYLLVDLLGVAILFYLTRFVEIVAPPGIFQWMLWGAYWIAQGCVATGLWVIAHECGHRAFSDYAGVDNAVGFVIHSCLLVPFFSWKYSHARHHANNGSIHRDEVFVPKEKDGLSALTPFLQHTPGRIFSILFMLTLGWPSYLLLNVSGRKYPRLASHFDPNSPIFNRREKLQIVASDLGLLAVSAGLIYLGWSAGFVWLLKVYGVPLMIVNAWLVTITYLQHTHVALPHYADSEWDWIRGALVTVDRDYGILNTIFHHITDTHVVHHFFSSMPHYHAQEATAAVRSVLGRYYLCDKTPVLVAIWREYKDCVFVEPDAAGEGIMWYKNSLTS